MKIADFSNQGSQMELVAPGVAVLSSTATGFGTKAYVGQGNDLYLSYALTGSPMATFTGEFVFCGLGASASDFPPEVKGKIALIQRGEATFAWKSRRAKEAGAVAVVIYNRSDAPVTDLGWGMRTATDPSDAWVSTYEYPLTVGMTYEDGLALRAHPNAQITASNDKDDYAVLQGTSMSTPHVVGAVALLWSLAPSATPDQVRTALYTTATDLGTPGQDPVFGYGFLNVFAAAKQLAPNAFGSAAQPTSSKPTTGRGIGRR
jgi:subtilisin family serine protease